MHMKKLFILAFAVMLALGIAACGTGQSGAYPKTPKEVAQRFMELYTAGDDAAADYVLFDGRNLLELAMTADAARTKTFPEELAKQKERGPVKVECVSERITTDEENGNPNLEVAYVECRVGDRTEYLMLVPVDGLWKVEITVKWAGEWFDGM